MMGLPDYQTRRPTSLVTCHQVLDPSDQRYVADVCAKFTYFGINNTPAQAYGSGAIIGNKPYNVEVVKK